MYSYHPKWWGCAPLLARLKRDATIQANAEKKAQHHQRKAAEKAAAALASTSQQQSVTSAPSPLNSKALIKRERKERDALNKVTINTSALKSQLEEQLRQQKESMLQVISDKLVSVCWERQGGSLGEGFFFP